MMNNLSKSEIKRQFKQVEAAARELFALGDTELKALPVTIEIKEEIALGRTLKGGAAKRQLKYVAKLLSRESLTDVFEFLEKRKGSKLKEDTFHHEAERLRDAVVNEAIASHQESLHLDEPWDINWSSDTIDELVRELPDINENEIRSSAYQYARTRHKSHYRALFKLIRSAADKKRRDSR